MRIGYTTVAIALTCFAGASATNEKEERIKVYSTPNGDEIIETKNVKVSVAKDGKETIEIVSTQSERLCHFSFDVDCTHEDDADRYATDSPLTVYIWRGYNYYEDDYEYYYNSKELVAQQTFDGFCSSGSEYIYVDVPEDECDVSSIDFEIDGDSALLISSVKLTYWLESYGWQTWTEWSNENGDAWCMSTDESDNQSYWGHFLVDGMCYKNLSFEWDGTWYAYEVL